MQTTTIWFTKSRRAQTTDDYETWIEGGVSPTLNIFDNNGDTRATVLILMRWREGKPGGGKGALLSENKSLTLATGNDQVLFAFESKRDEGIRIYDNDTCNTLTSRMGTGGGNTPMIAQDILVTEPIGFQPTDGGFANFNNDGKSTTLKASDAPAVAYDQPYAFSAGNSEKSHGIGLSEGITPPLRASASGTNQTPTVAYDEYNDSIGDVHQSLRAGTKQSTGVLTQTVVRRLTPIECERLQGFPDDWTAQRIDHKTGNVIEQKDSARYKQMGNAVAVPCVQWLLARIVERMDDV